MHGIEGMFLCGKQRQCDQAAGVGTRTMAESCDTLISHSSYMRRCKLVSASCRAGSARSAIASSMSESRSLKTLDSTGLHDVTRQNGSKQT